MHYRNKIDRTVAPADLLRVDSAGEAASFDQAAVEGAVSSSSSRRESTPLPISAIILCGGKSRRMGRQKAFLPYSGSTLIEHRLQRMQSLCLEVFLVTNQPEQYAHLSANVVRDIVPDRGPLAGILSGLLVSVYEHCFVVPCDMPLLDDHTLRAMAARRHGLDMLLYRHQNVVEPLVGLYARKCAPVLEQALFSPTDDSQNLIKGLKTETFAYTRKEPDWSLPPHFDVDTAGDYGKLISQVCPRS